MFKQGIKHGSYALLVTIISIALSLLLNNQALSELIIGITVILSWLIVGFFYKKENGSIFSIIVEPEKIKGFWHYILGAGLIWGPAKLFTMEFPFPDINPIFNLMLILLSIPMMGMSLIGVLIIGGFFYR
jgi:hypothetical protein